MGNAKEAGRILIREMLSLMANPLEGVKVDFVRGNVFKWSVVMLGPPDTIFNGGIFKAIMEFPRTFPMEPPSFKFTSMIWHPNIRKDGTVWLTMLSNSDRKKRRQQKIKDWTPLWSVRAILIAIVSILDDPVQAGISGNKAAKYMFNEWMQKANNQYLLDVKTCVSLSQQLAVTEGLDLPLPYGNFE